jgi:ABC-2 type transport system permease protein
MSDGPLSVLSWLSPIGWAQGARPFAGDWWWPLALGFAAAAGIGAVAFRTSERRDLGGGLVAPRPGPATGSERLASPFALAVRLQRGAVIGWTAGTAFLALVYGAITNAIEDFIDDSPEIADYLQTIGGNLTDSYVATAARVTALIGSGFAIQSILRIRSEEANDRTEPILATPVSRGRYWASHLAVTALGTVVVLVVSGLVLGIAAALSVGDADLVLSGLAAMITYLPATMVLVGIAALLIGTLPRRAALSWVALTAGFVVAMFGPILDLPGWAMRISPYENLTRVPAESVGVVPTLALTVLAAGLLGAGFAGYLRRDVPT